MPESSAIASVSALKVEPISNTPVVRRLMRSGSCASFGLFGSKSGSDTSATISPVRTLETRPDAALALYFSFAFNSSSRSACSTRRSIDSSTGRCRRSVAKPARCRSARPLLSSHFSIPAMPWLSMLTRPIRCATVGAGRIDALVLAQEADAGNAELVDVLLLLRRDLALQPDKTLARRQARRAPPLSSRSGSAAVRSSIASSLSMMRLRLAEQARRLDVGGEHLAVAVDDIGPRGRNRVLRAGAARAVAVGADREHHQPSGQHGIDRGEQPGSQIRPGRAPWRRDRHCARRAGCGSAAAATVPRAA